MRKILLLLASLNTLAFAAEIPPMPNLPRVVSTSLPWDVAANGLIEMFYTNKEKTVLVKTYTVISRQTWEPKNLAWITQVAERDNLRAFLVEYSDVYYVYWAKLYPLFYHVRQSDGKIFKIYSDPEEDGLNGNEKLYGSYTQEN